MSGSSDEEISSGDRDGYQRGGSDADDDEDEEDAIRKKKHRRKFDFGKRLLLNQFTKAKNQIRRVRSKKPLFSSSSSSLSLSTTASFSRNVNVSSRGKVMIISGGDDTVTSSRNGIRCKFCFLRPNVLETPDGSPSSDPNDPNFTNSMLKTLIEKNDFFSKDCNPHIESFID
ncbi:unnamed protein product [Trifolium pratense]|uniref:Uncharacterized protein n=1 Tax=Trifolium pratense TaxID=57577 RepID=A0ACB0IIN4_TRIPR|nr:unnamed protein product [Trifolium pratense]